MKNFFILNVFVVASFISNAQSVTSDQNNQTDFTKFKTYAWLAPGDSVLNRYRRDKLYCGAITYAANKELNDRGMKLDSLKPDAIMVFYTSREEYTTYSQSPTLSVGVGVAGPGYYIAGAAPVAGGKITATTKEEGVLRFSMFDTSTGKLVWTGEAKKSFKLSDDVQKLVMDYTVKIFKKFPLKK